MSRAVLPANWIAVNTPESTLALTWPEIGAAASLASLPIALAFLEPSAKTAGEGCRQILGNYGSLVGLPLDGGWATAIYENVGQWKRPRYFARNGFACLKSQRFFFCGYTPSNVNNVFEDNGVRISFGG